MVYYKQRTKGDCRIACVATMIQMPYDELVLYFKPEYRKLGVSDEETNEVMKRLGYTMQLYDSPDQRVEIARVPSILSVDSLNYSGHTHSIFWNGYEVYDPSTLKAHEELPDLVYRVIQVKERTPWHQKILLHKK